MKAIFYGIILSCIIILSSFKDETPKKNNSSAATKLKGTIVDKQNGEALAGVKVSLEGTTFVTYTDFDGNFEFNKLQNHNNFSISTELISYKKIKLNESDLNKKKSQTQNIKIELEHVN